MALAAGNRSVSSRQRKSRGGVVEFPRSPGGDGMARGTLRRGGRESCRDVIRHISTDGGSALERGCVAAIAVRGIQRVVVIRMAGSARRRKVRAHQCESGDAVVERCSVPTGGGVAVGAIR